MKWPAAGSIFAFFALSSLAIGQVSTIERQVRGKSDTNINAGIFITIRRDCTAGPLPVIRLVSPPSHGRVEVKQGRLRATNLKQCLGVELPAFIAIYRSAHDFIGVDRFTLEVTGTNGKPQLQDVIVEVIELATRRGI
jgi:hypothetical protein